MAVMKFFLFFISLFVATYCAPRHHYGIQQYLRSLAEDSSTDARAGIEAEMPTKHHNYNAMKEMLQDITTKCPDITRLYSIGKSCQGKDLYVIEISDNPGKHEAGEPEFKYIANMHGNEVVGKELLLNMARLICDNHVKSDTDKDERLTKLVKTTRMHFLPSMNPDGYEKAYDDGGKNWLVGRNNADDADLNRNFPDQFQEDTEENKKRECETESMMKWIRAYPFVLSANIHGGSLVANYPYDDNKEEKTEYTASPDDDVFKALALTYSKAHETMHQKDPYWECKDVPPDHFENGITNGAKWYNVAGGMQDYNYVHSDCMEITLELGCNKFPPASDLPRYWRENKEAMLTFIEQVHKGVKGFVRDGTTKKEIEGAVIKTDDRNHVSHSHEDGDYWRILMPGSYSLTVSKDGYKTEKRTIEVKENSNAVVENFVLEPLKDGDSRSETPATYNAELFTQIQNIDQQLMANAAQPWRKETQDYAPSVTLSGAAVPLGINNETPAVDSTLQNFFMNPKEDEQSNEMMKDFDLEKQDYFNRKTDLETADEA